MKSRRELLSGLLIDLAKAMFVALVTGKLINHGLITWLVAFLGMICTIILVIIALYVHPKAAIDKELKLWK